jgi:hypothetical protein
MDDKYELEEEFEGEQIQAIINDNNELVVPEQLQLDLEF